MKVVSMAAGQFVVGGRLPSSSPITAVQTASNLIIRSGTSRKARGEWTGSLVRDWAYYNTHAGCRFQVPQWHVRCTVANVRIRLSLTGDTRCSYGGGLGAQTLSRKASEIPGYADATTEKMPHGDAGVELTLVTANVMRGTLRELTGSS